MLWEKCVSQYTSCCVSDDIIACVDGCSGAVCSSTIEMTVPPFHSPLQDKDQVGSGEKVSWQFSS